MKARIGDYVKFETLQFPPTTRWGRTVARVRGTHKKHLGWWYWVIESRFEYTVIHQHQIKAIDKRRYQKPKRRKI